MASLLLATALALGVLAGPLEAAADYQYEDNVRDILDEAKKLTAQGALEEGAIEYENVLAIDPLHREAALGVFDLYLKIGAIAPADSLLPRLGRMGVDSTQSAALKTKLDAVRASPPKRVTPPPIPVGTATAAKPAPAASAAAGKPGAPAAVDDLGDLNDVFDAPPSPAAAKPAAAAPPAAPKGNELDDLGL